MRKIEYIICGFIFLILFSLIELNKYNESKEFNSFVLENTQIEDVSLNTYYDEVTPLKEQYNNDDIVATIEIENGNYKVPIVQGKDNDYYLDHLPDKKYSIMGSIFLDYRVNVDTSRKLLVFGHNSSKYEMPFAILENYYDEQYLNDHKKVIIKTTKQVREYEVFSVFTETSDFSYMKVDFSNDNYLDHLNNLKDKSIFDIKVDLNEESNILILQTCSTHKDYLKFKKKYLIIVLKEV